MPVCFQLTERAKPEAGPVSFQEIDDRLCAFLGVEPDPKLYHYTADNWREVGRHHN